MKISKPLITKNRQSIPKTARIVDILSSALAELFFVENPSVKKNTPATRLALRRFVRENKKNDVWIYYSSKNLAVHCVEEDFYFRLRTARNRNIITEREQIKYRESVVGIAGLSVGSAILSALVATGGPKRFKLADFDVIEITNLNRIRAKLLDVGESKLEVAAREVWELDPFADISFFSAGLNKQNMEEFISGVLPLNIMIDEMDDIGLKFFVRKLCRKHKIPVLMATDNGDSVILDIERFDIEPKRPIFHGAIDENILGRGIPTPEKWLKLAAKIIDPTYMVPRLQASLLEVGRSITGAPQLGPTASMAGAAMAYAVRRIVNNAELPSGRYLFGLEEKLQPRYMGKNSRRSRALKTKLFIKQLGL